MTESITVEVPHLKFRATTDPDIDAPDYIIKLDHSSGNPIKMTWLPAPCPCCSVPSYSSGLHVRVADLGHGVYMISYHRECGK